MTDKTVSINLPFVGAYATSHIQAIGDPTRFAILETLARSPYAVVDLAQLFPVSRPAISQHLRVLKEAGLIQSDRSGTRNVYHANPEGLAALRAHFDRMWTESLLALKAAAESTQLPAKEKHHGSPRSRARKKSRRR